MKKIIPVVSVIIALTGCASHLGEQYDCTVKKYVGSSPSLLMTTGWAVDLVQKIDVDQKTSVYQFHSKASLRGYYCDTSFTVVDGLIVDYYWEGNNCIAVESCEEISSKQPHKPR